VCIYIYICLFFSYLYFMSVFCVLRIYLTDRKHSNKRQGEKHTFQEVNIRKYVHTSFSSVVLEGDCDILLCF
jgi:hypothetical protein